MKLYTFNGQPMTMPELKILLELSATTIIKHINAGRNTSQSITCYTPKRAKPSRLSQIVIGSAGSLQRLATSKMR